MPAQPYAIGHKTGATVQVIPEFGRAVAMPAVKLDILYDGEQFDDVVEVDGEFFYAHDSEWDYVCVDGKLVGARLLYRRVVAMDAGDNVVRTRTAPAGLAGIAARSIAHGHLNAIYDDAVYVVQ